MAKCSYDSTRIASSTPALKLPESSAPKETPKVETAKALTDFFEGIESEKTTIFNPQPGRCASFTTVDRLSMVSPVSSPACHPPNSNRQLSTPSKLQGLQVLRQTPSHNHSSKPSRNRLASCNLSSQLSPASLSSHRTLSRQPLMPSNHR